MDDAVFASRLLVLVMVAGGFVSSVLVLDSFNESSLSIVYRQAFGMANIAIVVIISVMLFRVNGMFGNKMKDEIIGEIKKSREEARRSHEELKGILLEIRDLLRELVAQKTG